MKEKILKIFDYLSTMSTSDLTQLVLFLIAVINGALIIFGVSPVDVSENFVYAAISGLAVIAVPLYNKYKNWNISKEAITGQKVTDLLKDGVLTITQVENYIKNIKQQALKEEWASPTYPAEGSKIE
jgi:SPP1 family holin